MIACDLGSNTLRVVEIDCQSKERIKEFEKIVKSAEGIASSGNISAAAVERVIAAVKICQQKFDFSQGYRAVTTAALRFAENGKEVVQKIYDKTGVLFEIIDGTQEAEYTRIGVENRLEKLHLGTESYILLDLGGGSSEIVIKEKDQILSRSFPVGIVTVVEKYGLKNIEKGIREVCQPIVSFAQETDSKPERFIGSSGTPTTIAAFLQGMDYSHYDYRKINGYQLDLGMMAAALEKLLKMDKKNREKWVGTGRDDLVIAGVKLLAEIVKSFGFTQITVIDDGLREGLGIFECLRKNQQIFTNN